MEKEATKAAENEAFLTYSLTYNFFHPWYCAKGNS